MDFGIRGRVAFVSGGSQGIGAAFAELLGAEGCKVMVVARNQGPIDKTVAKIQAAGGTAAGLSADLLTPEGVDKAVAATEAKFGPISIALAQMQNMAAADFSNMEVREFENVFRAFTMSTIYLAQAVIPKMQQQGWGRFIHTGSGAAREPAGNIQHIYANTARPSTAGFLKTLSDEIAKDGVTVNTVAPGWIATESMYDYLREVKGVSRDQAEAFVRNNPTIPMRRAGSPEEFASLMVYLCSVQAGYITGQYMSVDGGKRRGF
jgi:3-oxoacyl-[acyl-carrier protein] reductase